MIREKRGPTQTRTPEMIGEVDVDMSRSFHDPGQYPTNDKLSSREWYLVCKIFLLFGLA